MPGIATPGGKLSDLFKVSELKLTMTSNISQMAEELLRQDILESLSLSDGQSLSNPMASGMEAFRADVKQRRVKACYVIVGDWDECSKE